MKFEQYLHEGHPERPTHDTYLASHELAAAVNASLAIGRPLLVTGEPGSGKTALAQSIALQLGLGEVLRYDAHSESRSQDAIYTFDAVRRLQQATRGAEDVDAQKYVDYRAFGLALKSGRKRVVLIDEIDKAPRDFCNGLLQMLESRLNFTIPETRETLAVQSDEDAPVVIFTTNEERVLPEAFLRRCVFFHIRFPETADALRAILRQHLGDAALTSQSLAYRAAAKLFDLRKTHSDQLVKKPGTAELLDWVNVLIRAGTRPEQLDVPEAESPHLGVLLKTKRDLELVLGLRPG